MPSPPGSHPSRQLTVRLPWPVWQRLCTLAASDPHGAKPGRVAATAVAAGLEVLEGGAGPPALLADLAAQVADLAWARMGIGEPRRYQCQACGEERLEWAPARHGTGCEVAALLARARPSERLDAPVGATAAADAPTGLPGPALARQVARRARSAGLDAKARAGVVTVRALAPVEADALTAENDRRWPGAGTLLWHPPPVDPRWGVDGVGKPYARESHTVSDVRPGGERVEVAVCAGDTVAGVRAALDAAWQARGEAVG